MGQSMGIFFFVRLPRVSINKKTKKKNENAVSHQIHKRHPDPLVIIKHTYTSSSPFRPLLWCRHRNGRRNGSIRYAPIINLSNCRDSIFQHQKIILKSGGVVLIIPCWPAFLLLLLLLVAFSFELVYSRLSHIFAIDFNLCISRMWPCKR